MTVTDLMRGWRPAVGDLLEVIRYQGGNRRRTPTSMGIVVDVWQGSIQFGRPWFRLSVFVCGQICDINPPFDIIRVLPKDTPRGQYLDDDWLRLGTVHSGGWLVYDHARDSCEVKNEEC